MGLRDILLGLPLEDRFSYDAAQNQFFINFEGMTIRSPQEIAAIRRMVEGRLAPLGHKVYTIVNYDNFSISPDLIDEYTAMVKDVVDRFYSGVTRYTTSSFMRMKLGKALRERHVAPYVFESADEAEAALHKLEAASESGTAAA